MEIIGVIYVMYLYGGVQGVFRVFMGVIMVFMVMLEIMVVIRIFMGMAGITGDIRTRANWPRSTRSQCAH